MSQIHKITCICFFKEVCMCGWASVDFLDPQDYVHFIVDQQQAASFCESLLHLC